MTLAKKNRTSKRDEERTKLQAKIALGLIGFFLFLPFLIVGIIYYYRLIKLYPVSETSQRIFEVWVLKKPIIYGIFIALFCSVFLVFAVAALYEEGSALPLILLSIIGVMILFIWLGFVWVEYHIARWVAATYFGVVVDRAQGVMYFPKDMANYSVLDYFKLKFISELGEMDSIHIVDIKRITRQIKTHFYAHGRFGSRGIKFESKQKRDECLSALEDALGSRKTMIEFE